MSKVMQQSSELMGNNMIRFFILNSIGWNRWLECVAPPTFIVGENVFTSRSFKIFFSVFSIIDSMCIIDVEWLMNDYKENEVKEDNILCVIYIDKLH